MRSTSQERRPMGGSEAEVRPSSDERLEPEPAEDPQEESLEIILDALQAGIDREANFAKLFRRYYRLVRWYFQRAGVGPDEVEDLSQETFLRIDRGIARFRREASFETWLLRIAGNVLRKEARRRSAQKRRGFDISIDADPAGVGAAVETRGAKVEAQAPLSGLLESERVRRVRDAIQELPPQMRQVVLLRVDQGLRYREIAEVLRISLSAVKVQLSRARERLREAMGEPRQDLGSE